MTAENLRKILENAQRDKAQQDQQRQTAAAKSRADLLEAGATLRQRIMPRLTAAKIEWA